MNDPHGPLPGFEPPSNEPAPYPSQLPSYEQAPYPSYQQAPYPGYPAMPGAAPPARRPGSVELAFRLIMIGTAIVVAMVALGFLLGADAIDREAREELAKDGDFTAADVQAFKVGLIVGTSVMVGIPMTLFVVFGFVMRGGRNWARVTLTVLLSLGMLAALITALVPVVLAVRLLAIVLIPVNIAVIVAMFQSSAGPFFDRRARMGGWTT